MGRDRRVVAAHDHEHLGDGVATHLQRRSAEAPSGSEALMTLQRTIGNQQVVGLLGRVQCKLSVGPANDPYEREADAVAQRVLSAIRSGPSSPTVEDETSASPPAIRRMPVVGAAGGDLDSDTESQLKSEVGRGRPLDGRIQGSMESAFGSSFDHVRIHEDRRAADLSNRVQAKAFTIGSDIFLGAGSSSSDHGLLAHELTHVIQQGGTRGF